jgi:hypothetical protein
MGRFDLIEVTTWAGLTVISLLYSPSAYEMCHFHKFLMILRIISKNNFAELA